MSGVDKFDQEWKKIEDLEKIGLKVSESGIMSTKVPLEQEFVQINTFYPQINLNFHNDHFSTSSLF